MTTVISARTLGPGQAVEVSIGGHTVRVSHETDGSGDSFLALGGKDCNLEGEMPGEYYLTPLTDEQRAEWAARVDGEGSA